MIQLTEVSKRLRIPTGSLNHKARQGVFKTAKKIPMDHCEKWFIEESEAEEIIKNYKKR
jgi:hypothetical protein